MNYNYILPHGLQNHNNVTTKNRFDPVVMPLPSLAGQPLHREEGSGVMPIHELFQRLCNTYGYATKT